jgi:hypothetical protein
MDGEILIAYGLTMPLQMGGGFILLRNPGYPMPLRNLLQTLLQQMHNLVAQFV